MYKKIFALTLAAACMNTQCKNTEITVAQVKAAQKTLQAMNNRTSRAHMGSIIAGLGLAGSLATLCLGSTYNPDLQNYVLGTCAVAVTGGLFVAWTGENEQGDPRERAKLIGIIEQAQE